MGSGVVRAAGRAVRERRSAERSRESAGDEVGLESEKRKAIARAAQAMSSVARGRWTLE